MPLALKLGVFQWHSIYWNIPSLPDLHILKLSPKMLRWHQNREIWKYLENNMYLPIYAASQLNSWRSAAVLQLLGLDCCASRAFSQESDKSLSLITNDNLTGATMHVTFNRFAICIHYVHLLFSVMKNWKVITTQKSIMDNKWDKMRKSTINWSIVLVSTFKVFKARNETIVCLWSKTEHQDNHWYGTLIMTKIQSSKHVQCSDEL